MNPHSQAIVEQSKDQKLEGKKDLNQTQSQNQNLNQNLRHDLERFTNMGTVLYIAAHPDDENTELLTYLARGRNFRTAYLSVTRGDGGQNVLGPDLGEKLGVARTQELLAARKLDGAQQFFTRAIDFGFSKNHKETLDVWNKNEMLSDMVRIIRQFQPDILLTRFSPEPGGTHGHHTASAVLAVEAFKLAADPKAFPEQHLPPWKAKRIMWNISKFQADKATGLHPLKIDIRGKDPVSGEAYTSIAERSRAMHKTQGFDQFQFQGKTNEARIEQFHLLDGEAASVDIMDGIDIGWSRIAGGAVIEKASRDLLASFDAKNPAASLPQLFKIRSEVQNIKSSDSALLADRRALLDQILKEILGIQVQSSIAQPDLVPGETVKIHHSVSKTASVPVKLVSVVFPEINKELKKGTDLPGSESISFDTSETLPRNAALTQPWWLRKEGSAGLFATDNPQLIGSAENAAAFPVKYVFEVSGQKFEVLDEPLYHSANPQNSSVHSARRRMDVIPPVSLHFASEVTLFGPGKSKQIEVELSASRSNLNGTLKLLTPANWKVSPDKQSFHLAKAGDKARISFTLNAPNASSTAKIIANVEVNGLQFRNRKLEVNYSHLPPQVLQPEASMKAVCMNLLTRGHKIAYFPGAGDSLPANMEEMGYEVKTLDDATLTAEQLNGVDAVVLGVRAFNVREKIGNAVPILFDYVKNGGTLIVQYNRPDKLKSDKIAPYDLHISADRVTDEKANMTFLAPEHPVLNSPNKISASDFDDWVQERGIYFPNKWDEHFTPILSCNDAGESPSKGALLVAPYGKGYYIYTGLVFFRELPAGVPGAYRLFANMLSIGK